MTSKWMTYCLLVIAGLFGRGALQAQYLGGTGSGTDVVALANLDPCGYYFGDEADGAVVVDLPNPDPCNYYAGDTVSGFDFAALANPDTCGFYFGDTVSGYSSVALANPDSCEFFTGTIQDGFALAYAPSPVACPTFYGTTADGFATATSVCTPLVVTATELQGRMEGDNAWLWWNTFSEINNLGFELQRSEDLLNWQEIAFMQGHDNSNQVQSYGHTDEGKPLGVSYYRWIQYDVDGATSMSNVVTLLKTENNVAQQLWLYPVPVQQGEPLHTLYEAVDSGAVHMKVVGLNGQLLMERRKIKTDTRLQVELGTGALATGSYLLVLDHKGKRMTKRFFVY